MQAPDGKLAIQPETLRGLDTEVIVQRLKNKRATIIENHSEKAFPHLDPHVCLNFYLRKESSFPTEKGSEARIKRMRLLLPPNRDMKRQVFRINKQLGHLAYEWMDFKDFDEISHNRDEMVKGPLAAAISYVCKRHIEGYPDVAWSMFKRLLEWDFGNPLPGAGVFEKSDLPKN